MGPVADQLIGGEFSDKVPPRFDGHNNYASYREDVSLWVNLTTLPREKHGPAIIGRLQGEAKTAAKTLSTAEICRPEGIDLVLQRLDKAYAIDKTNQLDQDLADFLDYSWKKEVSVEHFISGFHTRVDKIAELNLNDKLKGHLLLRQAGLIQQERHVVVGAASGSYDVNHISAALRNIYRNNSPADSSLYNDGEQRTNNRNSSRGGRRRGRGRGRGHETGSSSHQSKPTFYSYKTSPDADSTNLRVVIDSGACSSVVGKATLDKAMELMKIDKVEDTGIRQRAHRFGNYDDDQPSLFAIKMPFASKRTDRSDGIEFDVAFDVIDGELPFLLGLPTLLAMGANVHLGFMTMSFHYGGKYHRLKMVKEGDHIYLPFHPTEVDLKKKNSTNSAPMSSARPSTGRGYYTRSQLRNRRTTYSANAIETTLYTRRISNSPTRSEPNSLEVPFSSAKKTTYYRKTNDNVHCITGSGYTPPWTTSHQNKSSATPSDNDDQSPSTTLIKDGSYDAKDSVNGNNDNTEGNYKECVENKIRHTENSVSNRNNSADDNNKECVGNNHDSAAISKSYEQNRHHHKLRSSPDTHGLSKHDVHKLHLHLRHATATSLKNYIRAAGMWDTSMESIIGDVIQTCPCRLAHPPTPHVKVATRPPSTSPQAHISLDIIHLGGKNYLHTVDECTTWSEAGHIPNRTMETQIRVLTRIHHLRHGAPKTIRCDNEYNNDEFQTFCNEHGTTLLPVAANDHESNGLIENANRTLRSFYDRLRSCDKRSTGDYITAEAIYGKNISLGSKNVSAFELLYGRRPRILPALDEALPPPISVAEHAQNVARRRIQKMLRTPIHKTDDISIGDTVAIWRDASGWLAPARVTRVMPYYYEVIHNGRVKTSGINRTRLIKAHATAIPKKVEIADAHATIIESDDEAEAYENDNSPPSQTAAESAINDAPELGADADDIADNLSPDAVHDQHRATSQRIRTAEVQHVIEEARPILQEGLRSTRSQTAASRQELQSESTTPQQQLPYDANLSGQTHVKRSVPLRNSSLWQPLSQEEREEAFDKELKEWNNRGAYTAVDEDTLSPENLNIIGSHVVYKRKFDGTAKARIVPWGHRDKDKDYLRGDAPSIGFEIFRLLLSLCVAYGWDIGQMDVKAAFLQARGFNRLIYVRPPREAKLKGILWRLDAAAYGLTDSGRLWYLTSDSELIDTHGLKRSKYDHTLYYSHDADGNLDFVLAVQVDDYLYGGTSTRMEAFEAFLEKTFEVSKLARNNLSVMGCDITQRDDHSITLSQAKMLQDLDPKILLDTIVGDGDGPATTAQATVYRHVIGRMLFIGRMTSPILLLHASMAASKIADLRRHHLRALATNLKRLKRNPAELHFLAPNRTVWNPFVVDIISDAAMAAVGETKGRGGYIIFRRSNHVVHPIQWSARKLRRVARSSVTAEVLGAADAMSNGLYIREILAELDDAPQTELTVDSSALQSLSTSVKEPEERYNKVDLAAIREAYDDGLLNAVYWCPGTKLLADALTKDNRATGSLLLQALITGTHERPDEMVPNIGHPANYGKGRSGENRLI